MCTVLLPPGVNPTAVNKYIYLYGFIFEMSPRATSILCAVEQAARELQVGQA